MAVLVAIEIGKSSLFTVKLQHSRVKGTAWRVVVQFVAFRSAKGRPFAERKATIRQTVPPPPGEVHTDSLSLLRLIPVNAHVLRLPADGDDVHPAVAVEID